MWEGCGCVNVCGYVRGCVCVHARFSVCERVRGTHSLTHIHLCTVKKALQLQHAMSTQKDRHWIAQWQWSISTWFTLPCIALTSHIVSRNQTSALNGRSGCVHNKTRSTCTYQPQPISNHWITQWQWSISTWFTLHCIALTLHIVLHIVNQTSALKEKSGCVHDKTRSTCTY
jgi:hypothetical protein